YQFPVQADLHQKGDVPADVQGSEENAFGLDSYDPSLDWSMTYFDEVPEDQFPVQADLHQKGDVPADVQGSEENAFGLDSYDFLTWSIPNDNEEQKNALPLPHAPDPAGLPSALAETSEGDQHRTSERPKVKVSPTGVLQGVRKSGHPRSPLSDLQAPQGVKTIPRGENAQPRFAPYIAEPKVYRGKGPGRLGAIGRVILGPYFAKDPITSSNSSNALVKKLREHDSLRTYDWKAGHILNAEWSIDGCCTALTARANKHHLDAFESKVRGALMHLHTCYQALHSCHVDTASLALGIQVEVRVSERSWADVYPDRLDSEATQELCRSIPHMIVCRARLVGIPDLTEVAEIVNQHFHRGRQRRGEAYISALATLEDSLAGTEEVVVENERAADSVSEIEASREHKKRKAESKSVTQQKAKKRKTATEEAVKRFADSAGMQMAIGKIKKQDLYRTYKNKKDLVMALNESDQELLARYFQS
ncbi:hypothetical protein AB0N09_33420, partial [Streptomyces erythrochromogenes]|uniref:hypothetical protein n=1 Tax=Streptomyces erythrochromogenes TaxID=285574 RepID=UPI003413CC65